MELRVEDDLVVGSVLLEPSESLDDFSVLKLALERLRRSLKKGIVPADSFRGRASQHHQHLHAKNG
jgi:hypothetical protein